MIIIIYQQLLLFILLYIYKKQNKIISPSTTKKKKENLSLSYTNPLLQYISSFLLFLLVLLFCITFSSFLTPKKIPFSFFLIIFFSNKKKKHLAFLYSTHTYQQICIIFLKKTSPFFFSFCFIFSLLLFKIT